MGAHPTSFSRPRCASWLQKHTGLKGSGSAPVQLLDGALRVLAVHKVDKCKAARLAGVPVVCDVYPRDRPEGAEQILPASRAAVRQTRLGVMPAEGGPSVPLLTTSNRQDVVTIAGHTCCKRTLRPCSPLYTACSYTHLATGKAGLHSECATCDASTQLSSRPCHVVSGRQDRRCARRSPAARPRRRLFDKHHVMCV